VVFQTKDGRYMNVTGAHPHLNDRALRLLHVWPTGDAIKNAIKQWDAQALEDAMGEQRVIGGMHRTTEEWLQHPEGQALAKVPLIDIGKIGDSDAVPFTPNPKQPLSRIKCLALTHVIAGSCGAARPGCVAVGRGVEMSFGWGINSTVSFAYDSNRLVLIVRL